MADAENCAVCRDVLLAENDGNNCTTHTLECGHTFHIECVMAWFRQGQSSCPNCRDLGAPLLPRMTANAVFAYLRRHAKQRDASPLLKHLNAKYDSWVQKAVDAKKAVGVLKKSKLCAGHTVASVLIAMDKLRRKARMCEWKTWRARMSIMEVFRVTQIVLPARRRRG